MDIVPARCSKGESFKLIWPSAKPIVGWYNEAADDVASASGKSGEGGVCFEFQFSLQMSGEGGVFWVPI